MANKGLMFIYRFGIVLLALSLIGRKKWNSIRWTYNSQYFKITQIDKSGLRILSYNVLMMCLQDCAKYIRICHSHRTYEIFNCAILEVEKCQSINSNLIATYEYSFLKCSEQNNIAINLYLHLFVPVIYTKRILMLLILFCVFLNV